MKLGVPISKKGKKRGYATLARDKGVQKEVERK